MAPSTSDIHNLFLAKFERTHPGAVAEPDGKVGGEAKPELARDFLQGTPSPAQKVPGFLQPLALPISDWGKGRFALKEPLEMAQAQAGDFGKVRLLQRTGEPLLPNPGEDLIDGGCRRDLPPHAPAVEEDDPEIGLDPRKKRPSARRFRPTEPRADRTARRSRRKNFDRYPPGRP